MRRITFIASSEVRDRHGEVIALDGMNLSAFAQDRALVDGHRGPRVGTVVSLTRSYRDGVAVILGEAEMLDTEAARRAWAAILSGETRSVSVGFSTLARDGSTHRRTILGEIAIVRTPACPWAVIESAIEQ